MCDDTEEKSGLNVGPQDDAAADGPTAGTAGAPPPNRTAWLRILRPPNLFTVPGDPLAGALLTGAVLGAAIPWDAVARCMGSSLLFYMAGLFANDYCDREEDARERPSRPIPSGAVPAKGVLTSALLLTAAAISLASETGEASLVVGLALAAAIWAYNLGLKRMAVFGPLAMGLCRGLSLLLGATGVARCMPHVATPWLAAGMLTLFIAAVTAIARHETQTLRTPVWRLVAPASILFLGMVAFVFVRWDPPALVDISRVRAFTLGLAGMAVVWAAFVSGTIAGTPAPKTVQKCVGLLLRGLILTQAALCATTGPSGELAALGVLALFPVSGWLGRWFYGS
jgi:4-hydroxybenzoate polyprenyltransferase